MLCLCLYAVSENARRQWRLALISFLKSQWSHQVVMRNPSVHNFSLSANWFVNIDVFRTIAYASFTNCWTSLSEQQHFLWLTVWRLGALYWRSILVNRTLNVQRNGPRILWKDPKREPQNPGSGLIECAPHLRELFIHFWLKGVGFFSVVEHVLQGLWIGCWSASTVDQILAKGDKIEFMIFIK